MKICMITDNPALTTGFANASRPFAHAFAEAGHEVHVAGRLGGEATGDEPYELWECDPNIDPMAVMTTAYMIRRVRPDVVWLMSSPGNAISYTHRNGSNIINMAKETGFKVINYSALENLPVSHAFIDEVFKPVMEVGENIMWSKCAHDAIPAYSSGYIHFGSDHADFRKYNPARKQQMREATGLNGRTLVGSVGINKRTKGHAQTIQVARILKDAGHGDEFVFYQHTNHRVPTMQGYDLYDLARNYDVLDMFIWPPGDNIAERGTYWRGIEREGAVDEIHINDNPTKSEKVSLFKRLGYIDRMNMLDIYLDLSQVEGWGMPQMEALACGVPLVGVSDKWVRDELFSGARYDIPPLPSEMWEFWQTGARLVTVNPRQVAETLLHVASSPRIMYTLSDRGLARALKFRWADATKKMLEAIER